MELVREWIEHAKSAEAPAPDDLPPVLRRRLVRERDDGPPVYRLYVYPEGGVFEGDALDSFIREVRSVAPDATGGPVLFRAFLDRTRSSLTVASLLAALIVTILLAVDFRRARDVALALVPLALGVTWLVGLMGWLGIDANLANVAALPLVLGIGVDDGVHLIHRHRRRGSSASALGGVLRAIVLTTVTTVAAFGALGLAEHRGMRSFALVMTLGAACCLAATLFVLPALLPQGESSSSSTEPSTGSQRRAGTSTEKRDRSGS
jgi:predicted RND superfamily exporter protein